MTKCNEAFSQLKKGVTMFHRFWGNLKVELCMCVLACLIWAGCGQAPLATDEELNTLPRAEKKTRSGRKLAEEVADGVFTNSVSGTFKPNKKGKLVVEFPKYDADVRVRSAELIVDKGSLAQKTTITMDVTSGNSLEDVSVVFGPSGTVFDPSASLVIKLKGGDPGVLQAYHYSDDQVTDAEIKKETLSDGSSGWKIVLKVPGFSRYSLGYGD